VGQVRMTSLITEESAHLSFAAVHFGDHNLLGGVRPVLRQGRYEPMKAEVKEHFERVEWPGVIRAIDRHFEADNYTTRSLFRDEQRKVLRIILDSSLEQAAAVYRHLHEDQAPLMHFLIDIDAPLPDEFRLTANVALNTGLRLALTEPWPNLEEIEAQLRAAELWNIDLDDEGLAYALQQSIDQLAIKYGENPEDLEQLDHLVVMAELARSLPFEVNLWKAQNIYWNILRTHYPEVQQAKQTSGSDDAEWLDRFRRLGDLLSVRVD
jgi:hypothetical protein